MILCNKLNKVYLSEKVNKLPLIKPISYTGIYFSSLKLNSFVEHVVKDTVFPLVTSIEGIEHTFAEACD